MKTKKELLRNIRNGQKDAEYPQLVVLTEIRDTIDNVNATLIELTNAINKIQERYTGE